jgi:hypothetical protein
MSIEPVLGWRVWRLQEHRGHMRLASMTRDDVWPAREALLSSYKVDLMPRERVATQLKLPAVLRARRRRRMAPWDVVEGVLAVLSAVGNVLLVVWTLSGFLFLGLWIIAMVVGVFLGNE